MLQLKNILIFDRDPAKALELAMVLAEVGATIIGPATTVNHVRLLANRTRLDGVVYDLDQDDADAGTVLKALAESGTAVVVISDADPTVLTTGFPQIAVLPPDCPYPVVIGALDARIDG